MFISTAFAQTAGGPASGSGILVQMAPLVLIFVVFYFLLIRPQQKRMKAHKAKIDAVKKGDQVITGGGLLGKEELLRRVVRERRRCKAAGRGEGRRGRPLIGALPFW